MVKYKHLTGIDADKIVSEMNDASGQGYDELVFFVASNDADAAFQAIVSGDPDRDSSASH